MSVWVCLKQKTNGKIIKVLSCLISFGEWSVHFHNKATQCCKKLSSRQFSAVGVHRWIDTEVDYEEEEKGTGKLWK